MGERKRERERGEREKERERGSEREFVTKTLSLRLDKKKED